MPEYAEVGHMSSAEAPERFNAHVRAFLGSLDRPVG